MRAGAAGLGQPLVDLDLVDVDQLWRGCRLCLVRVVCCSRSRSSTLKWEALMALARVVTFDGVSKQRIDEMKREMDEGGRPDDVPATEILVLHDPEAGKSLAILFFESEDDYRRGDEALNAMPAGDTPGQRTSVTKYEVAARMTV
jgi:hypothetical protein